MSALIRARPAAALLRNLPAVRQVSTSPKKSDTATATVNEAIDKQENVIDFSIEAVKKSTNWVSYGYDRRDKEWDRQVMRGSFFLTVTMCMVVGGFVWTYLPDPKMRDWAQREAFILLREREAAGVEFISADLIEASLVELPTDEELGDTDIII